MRCVVPTCNLDSGSATESITFHSFPQKPSVRAVWLKLLKKEPWKLRKDSAVCSKHFLKGDLYTNRSGRVTVRAGALPVVNVQTVHSSCKSELKVCRICFTTDCKLYKMTPHDNLEEPYRILTGVSIENEENLPPYLCTECAHRLLNCIHFRNRSLRAHSIMLEAIKKHNPITLESIKSVIHSEDSLGSCLKVTQMEHYNIEIKDVNKEVENNEERKEVGLTNTDNIKLESDVIDLTLTGYHKKYFHKLPEKSDIKMETDDFVSQNVSDVDMTSNVEGYMDKDDSKDSTQTEEVKLSLKSDEVEIEISIDKNTTSNDSFNKDAVTKNVDNGNEDGLLIAKKVVTEKNKQISHKGKPRRYNTRQNPRIKVNKKLMTKLNAAKLPQTTLTNELNRTNIVKLRKRVAGDVSIPAARIHYGSLIPYRTVSDVPLWTRLKTHTAINPFTCTTCHFKTGYKDEFKEHMKLHVDERHNLDEKHNVTSTKVDDKSFFCDVCKQAFSDTESLNKHKEATSDGKPYSCRLCNKKFQFNFRLQQHYVKHSAKKK